MKHLILKLSFSFFILETLHSNGQTKKYFLQYFPDSSFAIEIARMANKNLNDTVTIQDLQHIDSLNLGYSELKSIIGIHFLKNLRYLGCSKNDLKIIPEEIGQLKKLETLEFAKAYSLEKLPNTIGNCISLQKIYLGLTQVKYLPKSIGKLKNLQYLYVGPANLTYLPEELGLCTNLIELDVHSNNIKKLPNSICNLHKLEDLNISYCGLTKLPENFGQLKNIKKINLFENNIRKLPKSIRNLTKLEKLDLYNNYHLDDSYLSFLPKQLTQKNIKEWNRYW